MLNEALAQTAWAGPSLDESSWRVVLRGRLAQLDWSRVASDVRPFLATSAEAELLTLESLEGLL